MKEASEKAAEASADPLRDRACSALFWLAILLCSAPLLACLLFLAWDLLAGAETWDAYVVMSVVHVFPCVLGVTCALACRGRLIPSLLLFFVCVFATFTTSFFIIATCMQFHEMARAGRPGATYNMGPIVIGMHVLAQIVIAIVELCALAPLLLIALGMNWFGSRDVPNANG